MLRDVFVANALVAIGLVFLSLLLSGLSRPRRPGEGRFFLLAGASWIPNLAYLILLYLESRPGLSSTETWIAVRVLNNSSFALFLLAAAAWRSEKLRSIATNTRIAIAMCVLIVLPVTVHWWEAIRIPVTVLSSLFGVTALFCLSYAFRQYFKSRRQPYPPIGKYLIVYSFILYGLLQFGAIVELSPGLPPSVDAAFFVLGSFFKLALLSGLGVLGYSVLLRFEEGQDSIRQARMALNTIAQMKHEMGGPTTELRLVLASIERELSGIVVDTSNPHLKTLQDAVEELRLPLERLIGILDSYPTFVRRAFLPDGVVQKENCNLNSICEEVIINVKLTMKPRVRIEKDLRSGPTVLARRPQVFQILRNLLKNAIEATEHQSTAVVRIGSRIVRSDRDEQLSIVFVTDNGPGIPREIHERVFDDGFTTKSSSGGEGHGLYIGRTLARENGGDLRIAEIPGASLPGATLLLELPFAGATNWTG